MNSRLAVAAAVALSLATVAAVAAPVIYTASDPGVGPGEPFPNSAVAAANFATAVSGTQTLITFESAPVGAFTDLAVAPGVIISGADFFGDPQQILDTPGTFAGCTGPVCGFNTTPMGSHYVQLIGGTLRFGFAAPVDAFGAYFTGVQLVGETIIFDDGTSQVLPLPSPGPSGGVEFFGFTDTGRAIASILVNANVSDTGDIIGIDDVRLGRPFSIPEPVSLAMLGIGLAGLGLLGRRRRTA